MARPLASSLPRTTHPQPPDPPRRRSRRQTLVPCPRPLGLNRRLRRWLAVELRRLRPAVAESAAACQADRYRKHFDSFAHACLLLFHGLAGGESLHQSYAAFATCPGLVALSGLGPVPSEDGTAPADDEADTVGVSYSQVAASNTSRPAAFLAGLVPALLARVRQSGREAASEIPLDLHVLDSTFLRLSLRLSPWLPGVGGSDVPGVRVQLRYVPALDLPEHVLITDTRTNDCLGLDQTVLEDPAQLAALCDQTLVIDLGYYSHRRFAALRAARVHFVSRLHAQATVTVEADLPVQLPLPLPPEPAAAPAGAAAALPPPRITVLGDQRVTVGSPHNRKGAVLTGLRLVTARVEPLPAAARRGAQPVEYRVLTDRWDLPAQEVVQCYLWRWQIELFFRWLKRFVHLPRLLGASPNAVELTVWLAIVVHLLALLAAHALGRGRRSPALLRQLPWALAQLTAADAAAAPPDPVAQVPLPARAAGGRPPP